MEKTQDYKLAHIALGTAIAFPVGIMITLLTLSYSGNLAVITAILLTIICGVVAFVEGVLSIVQGVNFKDKRYFFFGISSLLILFLCGLGFVLLLALGVQSTPI